MKKLNTIHFLMMLLGASVMLSCDDNDDVAPETNVQTPGTDDDQTTDDEDTDDDKDPDDDESVTEFKMKVDGVDFVYKVFNGRYFPANKSIDIEVRELDDTNADQRAAGFQINFATINTPGVYDIEEAGLGNLVAYYFKAANEGRSAISGDLTIKKISETRFEATFNSITIPPTTENLPNIILTDGVISIDLVRTDD